MTRKKKGKTGSVSAVSHVILKKKMAFDSVRAYFYICLCRDIYIYI